MYIGGGVIGVIKGDTRSLDYGSYEIQVPAPMSHFDVWTLASPEG